MSLAGAPTSIEPWRVKLSGFAENSSVAHAAKRWAAAVVGVTASPHDTRTLAEWGRCVGRSVGALRAWCYAAGVPPRESLAFARLLRAVMISKQDVWDPYNLLDVVDPRSMRRLLGDGGLPLSSPSSPSLEEFLERQRLISNRPAIGAVRELLRGHLAVPRESPESPFRCTLPDT